MTDPVHSDALRDMGAALTSDGHVFGPLITAAADEVDRLRAELNARDKRTGMEISFRHTVEQKYDRLIAKVKDAPHDVGCATPAESLLGTQREPNRTCACWKADAL